MDSQVDPAPRPRSPETSWKWAVPLVLAYCLLPIAGGHGAAVVGFVLVFARAEQLALGQLLGWIGIVLVALAVRSGARNRMRLGVALLFASAVAFWFAMDRTWEVLPFASPFLIAFLAFLGRTVWLEREG